MAKKKKSPLDDESVPFVERLHHSLSLVKAGANDKREKLDDVRTFTEQFVSIRAYMGHINELFDAEKKELWAYLDAVLPKLTKELYGSSRDKIDFDGTGKNIDKTYTLTRVQTRKVTFDAPKVEKAVGKKLAKRVITKKYMVDDMEALITLCKEHGITPKELKALVHSESEVDKKEIDRLVEIGEISLDTLKGAFTVKESEPYYRVTEKNRGPKK